MKENKAFKIPFITKPPGYNQQMINSVVYHPCPSRLSLKAYQTSDLNK